MEKYEDFELQAKKHFRTADHMAYVTFSLLKENRLMIKIISELAQAAADIIKAYLYYEYAFKRIKLYKDPVMNLKTFVEKVALNYIEKHDIKNIINLLEIEKKHKEAPVEFVRKEKFVILLGDRYETLTIQRVRELLHSVQTIIAGFPNNKI